MSRSTRLLMPRGFVAVGQAPTPRARPLTTTRLVAAGLFLSLVATPSCQCDNAKPVTPPNNSDVTEPEATGQSLAVAPPEEPPTLPDGPAAPAGQDVFSSISNCAVPDCPVEISFTQPMTPKTPKGVPAIAMRPAVAETWAWKDSSTLAFTPAAGSLAHGTSFEIDVPELKFDDDDNAETPPRIASARTFYQMVPYLRIGVKVAYWPVIKGAPRIVLASQVWSGLIGSAPLIVGYDQPVDVKAQADKISMLSQRTGKPISVDVRRPKDSEFSFDHAVEASHFIAVQPKAALQDGEGIAITLPSFYSATEEGAETYSLTVAKTFAIDELRAENGDLRRVYGYGGVHLKFKTPISLERAQAAIKIEPAPKSLNLTTWADTVNINGTFEMGQEYKIVIDSNFKDALGNTLKRSDSDPKLIFRVRDKSPRLYAPQGPMVLEAGHDGFPVKVTNVGAVTMTTSAFKDPADFAALLKSSRIKDCNVNGTSGASAPVSVTPKLALNATGTETLPIARPGLYCASLTTLGRGTEGGDKVLRAATAVQVTALNAVAKVSGKSAFVWVTSLKDARPVAGAKVQLFTATGKSLGEAMTAADGTATVNVESPLMTGGDTPFVVVNQGDDALVSLISSDRLTSAWSFGMKDAIPGLTPLRAALFSERGVYRPGETVHLKLLGHPEIATDGSTKVNLVVNDSRGRKVLTKDLSLDAFHSASHALKLGKEANVGAYSVIATVGERKVTARFRVEEYRVPTFEVRLSSEQKTWERASNIDVLVDSRYMHGARMPGREVSYSVTREVVPFVSDAFPTFTFGVAGAEIPPSMVLSKVKRLDGMGQTAISFAANHPAHAGPMRYVVDANVTDVDRQNYSGRLAKVVHAARFYVGVQAPSRTIVDAGETIDAKFAAVFTDGRPMSGAKLKARLERVDHHQTARLSTSEGDDSPKVEIDNHEVERELKTCDVVTREGQATCSFKVPSPGEYRVRVWARDKNGRDVQAGYTLIATGSGSAAWPRYERARIDLVTDKSEYTPGDVAKLVVKSPFDVATGLLTIERDGIRTHRLINVDKNTPAIEVKITEDMAPNVYASIVLTRGRIHDEKDSTGFETGAPSFRIGVANLVVRPDAARLAVEIAPQRRAAAPGDSVGIDLEIKDHKGVPVQGQVTLMVVDEAVLGMSRFQTPDPIAALFKERAWDVRTLVASTDLPNARRARKEMLFLGGDGGEGLSIADFPAELRKLFDSTALFLPDLKTDAQGRATATVKFPDNLTTYRIMAVVVDKTGRAGHADKKITVRKPLIVQPVLPRFVYPGDALKIEAMVVNGSDDEGEVSVVAEVKNATLSGDAKQGGKTLEHGAEALFGYSITVPDTLVARPGTEIVVKFAGVLKTKGKKTFIDGVEVKIPVLSPGTKRSAVVTKAFSGEQSLEVKVGGARIPNSLKVEVIASGTMLTELKDSVEYLMGYPNGCIEQTVSTAYPLVLLEDLLPEIGIEVDRAKLKEYRDAGLKRVLSFQTTSGGLSYWPGEDKPHAFATAFGLTALLEAKKKGEPIPQPALDRMAAFLEETLKKQDVTETIAHGGIADADSRALFVMTLGRMGRKQHAHVAALWRDQQKLGPFGLSFLATAIEEGSGDKALLQPVLDKILTHAEVKEAEAYFDGKRKGGYSMDSPLRSHAGALLAYATAAPSDPVTAKLLKGLLARRQYGMWGNTQENVFGMMAVAKLASSQDAAGATSSPTISIGDKTYEGDALEAISDRVKRVEVKNAATGVRGEDAATVTTTVRVPNASYVTLRAEWEAALNDETRKPRSNGFRIERSYETESGSAIAADGIALGSVVRVRLKVTTEAAFNYVAIDDKLPAGLEPMNLNLATTAKASLGEMTPARKLADAALSFQEMRDHRVAFYVDAMAPGTYEFVYLARATIPGKFLRPAAHVEAMYDTERLGDTRIDEVEIR